MSKVNKESLSKQVVTNKKPVINISDLAESRIITKNLVYVIGLSSNVANKDILAKWEYFGQYGTITKIVVNRNKAYNQNNPHGPSFSAYVTYAKPYEASIAILSLDNTIVDNHLIRASFGTTK
jgi:CCR4-NOT transcription complex subunit 4